MAPSPESPEEEMLSVDAESRLEFGCNQWPLHYACRIGNLDQVQYMVDVLKLPVNEADAHDATPLYLAALTGNTEICQFLLERGAKCEGGDSARVFYVALTPELRKLLQEWSLSAASRDVFLESLRLSFNNPTHADCLFELEGGNVLYLHRIMLYVRCPMLATMISQKPSSSDVPSKLRLPQKYSKVVVAKVLEYLYTGTYETRELDEALLTKEFARQFGLEALERPIETAVDRHFVSLRGRLDQLHNVKLACHVEETNQLKDDMERLGHLVSNPDKEWNEHDSEALKRLLDYSDATLQCNDSTWRVHQFRMCQESEFIERALLGGFREARDSLLDLTVFAPSSASVRLAIQWMYADKFLENVELEVALEVLEFSFAVLSRRLAAYVSNTALIPVVDTSNVFELLSLARMHELERLEDRCVKVIGFHLEELSSRPEFDLVLKEEACEIQQGGDLRVADVPLAAEIRRVISKEKLTRPAREVKMAILQQAVECALT